MDHGLAVRISKQEADQPEEPADVSEWPTFDESELPDPFAQVPSGLEG